MLRTRVIPCLQLVDAGLVKTTRFKAPSYIGDPINTVRIFNELEVDELCFLDIRASISGKEPDFDLLRKIADECFMPLSYGGGVRDFETAQRIFSIGFEKIIVNTHAIERPDFIAELAEHFGAQSVIASIDAKKRLGKGHQVYSHSGTKKTSLDLIAWAKKLEALGAGELLVTSIRKEGTWSGYDLGMLKAVCASVTVPVIAHGGAGSVDHIGAAVRGAGAAAVALGNMVVYQQEGMGVLVNFPDRRRLEAILR